MLCAFLLKANDGISEGTSPTQMCEWGKSGFTLCSLLMEQAIWKTCGSLLLFLLYNL